MLASCSARLLQPILRVASSNDANRDLVPQSFWTMQPDDRVPLDEIHEMLDRAVERLKDEGFAFKLGNVMTFGTGGVFDYVVRSSSTVKDSFATASRYARLLSDSFHLTMETRKRQVILQLHDESPSWLGHAADFSMSAFYKLHVAEHVPAEHTEIWLPYAAPADTSVHLSTFAGATLKFDAPFYGFAFEASYAESPMPGADATLQALLRARAESMLTELSSSHSLAAVVRRILQQSIPSGDVSAEGVARALRMSRRTLTRRLEREHTTFQAELDAARRKLATEHLRERRTPLTEIAFLAGFSHVESFHRAFKRWTGQTPLEYRTAANA